MSKSHLLEFHFYKDWCKKVGLKQSNPKALKMYLAIKGVK